MGSDVGGSGHSDADFAVNDFLMSSTPHQMA
jgi:hypothetical protein